VREFTSEIFPAPVWPAMTSPATGGTPLTRP